MTLADIMRNITLSSKALRTVEGREAEERLPCLSSALWATIVALLAKPVVLTVPASPLHCRGMDRDARVFEGGLGQ